MREERITAHVLEKQFYDCKELQPCTCINQPPYHCGVCSRELTPERVDEAKRLGLYPAA